MSRRVVRSCVSHWLAVTAAAIAIAVPAVAAAQTSASSGRAPRPANPDPKWEVDLHFGALFAGVPPQGLASLPLPNPAIAAVNGTQTRQVPSWFFGDGARLFAEAESGGVAGDSVASLDDVVSGPSSNPGKSWTAGGRVARLVNSRVSIEGTVEYSKSQLRLRKTAVDAIEATRSSFISAWGLLFAADPATFQNGTVTATAVVDPGATHQIAANGAVVFNIITHRRTMPYTSVAVGVLSNGGRPPSVTMTGHYTTLLNGSAPIDETDAMTLRYDINRTLLAASVALGLKHMVGDRWGVRVEMREQLNSNPIANQLSASPTVVLSSTASQQGAVSTPHPVSVQLANIPNSSTQSSLTGAFPGSRVFTGTGMESRFTVTGGIFWRF